MLFLPVSPSRFAAARIIFPYFLVSHAATKHGTGGASRGGITTEGAIQVSHPYRDRIMAYTERLLMAGTYFKECSRQAMAGTNFTKPHKVLGGRSVPSKLRSFWNADEGFHKFPLICRRPMWTVQEYTKGSCGNCEQNRKRKAHSKRRRDFRGDLCDPCRQQQQLGPILASGPSMR